VVHLVRLSVLVPVWLVSSVWLSYCKSAEHCGPVGGRSIDFFDQIRMIEGTVSGDWIEAR
jgi:hypothetical protein